MISEITKAIEKRKNELSSMLKKGEEDISPEIKHQVYGAINEIDIFLRTLSYYKELEMTNELKELKLVKPDNSNNGVFKFFSRKRVNKKDIKQNSE